MLLKDISFILFAITAAGVVSCGGPKMFHRTSSIVKVIVFLWFVEISEGIQYDRFRFIF